MLQNFLALTQDVPTRVHFDDYHEVKRTINDKELGVDKKVTSHVFWIDRVNGEPAARTFSVLSEGLWSQLAPYIPGDRFRDHEFEITKRGEGFLTTYEVEVFPFAATTKKKYIGSQG